MAQPGQLEGQQATATAQGNSLSIPLQASSSSSATASTSKRRVATTPSLSLSIDDDDDDDIVIVSSSSSTRPGQPQLRKKSRQVKASTSRGSTRSSTPVITIPDSPPPKKPSSSFAPLSQLYRAGRERRKANEPVEARWPTQEEHGSVVSVAPQARDLQRWKSSVDVVDSGKGKGKMREDDTSADIFQRLTASIAFNSAEAVPPSTLNHTPQLHYQQLSTVGSLLPSYTSHPLLDRIADPFRGPSPSRNNFLRPHDRVNNRASNDEWRDIWTAKYAPKAANEVLGSSSGRSAGHLKDWLSELAIWSSSGGFPRCVEPLRS